MAMAATATAPAARPRHSASEFQKPERSGFAEQAPLELAQHACRRRGLGEFAVEARQPRAPEGQIGLERSVRVQAPAKLFMLGRGQQAERVLGDEELVLVHSADVTVVAHPERHSLSFNRLRRSQVRMVLSGTSWRAANSS